LPLEAPSAKTVHFARVKGSGPQDDLDTVILDNDAGDDIPQQFLLVREIKVLPLFPEPVEQDLAAGPPLGLGGLLLRDAAGFGQVVLQLELLRRQGEAERPKLLAANVARCRIVHVLFEALVEAASLVAEAAEVIFAVLPGAVRRLPKARRRLGGQEPHPHFGLDVVCAPRVIVAQATVGTGFALIIAILGGADPTVAQLPFRFLVTPIILFPQ
jgi:hypothetical protein